MLKKISVKRLKVGLYIHLKDVPWFSHPFFKSNFMLTKQDQVREIQAIGCEYVYYDPERSEDTPLDIDSVVDLAKTDEASVVVKKQKSSELRKRKEAYLTTEKNFYSSVQQANRIMQGVLTGQIGFCEEARKLAHEFARLFLDNVETTLNLINLTASDDDYVYYHSLNVSILSCMLGKELGITDNEMQDLAFGALMHDIGKSKIPKKVTYKRPPLTKHEVQLIERHPLYGVGLLSGMRSVNRNVMKIIYYHHVHRDGQGFPQGIEFDDVPLLSKIVAVADLYDNLINKRDSEKSLTPHKALAHMFRLYSSKFDEHVLSKFIRMLGVYPPGSICQLDTGEVAMVVSIGDNPLLPSVVVCDLNVPKNEAMIVQLGSDIDSKVKRVISPKDLSDDQLRYLSPKGKIGYYAESKKQAGASI